MVAMERVTILEHSGTGAVADWLFARLNATLENEDCAIAITVPGGSTPFPIMQELITHDLDWSRLTVWPGDDRIVAEDHEASNTGKVRALFEPVGAVVRALTVDAVSPQFALSWLGMGDDGHIASLFPNTDPQMHDPLPVRRVMPDPLPAHAPFDRITLTMPSLLNTDAILFTLGGSQAKREVFEAAFKGEHDLPIARLLRGANEKGVLVTCFM